MQIIMDRNELSQLILAARGDFSYLYVPMQSTWNTQPAMRATFRFPKAVK